MRLKFKLHHIAPQSLVRQPLKRSSKGCGDIADPKRCNCRCVQPKDFASALPLLRCEQADWLTWWEKLGDGWGSISKLRSTSRRIDVTLFQLGEVQISAKASAALSDAGENVRLLLSRHQSGDWGDVSASIVSENEFGVQFGQSTHQISSQYRLDSGLVLVMTTSSDRTVTLIQLLSEHIVRDVDAVDGYAAWAQTYDLEVNSLIAAEEPRAQRIFNEVPMRTAIDVGAWTGRHAIDLAKRGAAVTAVDQSFEMLAVAREKAAREGLEIDFRIGSLDDRLPSEDEQFDFLVCALTLSHVPDIERAINECARVVKRGGSILISDIHPDVAHGLGWTARVRRPGVTYNLPFAGHTLSDYFDSLTAAGCSVTGIEEVAVRDAPDGTIPKLRREKFPDWKLCLVILARKDTATAVRG